MSMVRTTIMLLLFLLLIGECLSCRPITVRKPPLVSCTRNGGKCRELYACPPKRQATVKTICILRRKVCCMKTDQQ